MKRLIFMIFAFSCLLSGLAQAQTIPWVSIFPYNTYYFRGSHVGPWGVPDGNTPLVGAGAYCNVGDRAIGITIGPSTSCSTLISITAGGGKAPNAWVLYSLGYNWKVSSQNYTEQWYYWTSCDVSGVMQMSYDNPTASPGYWAPESC